MDSRKASGYAGIWLLGYVLFVIYGSLVPLDFHLQSLAEAWERFQQIPMLRLGIESRADWVANGVLYVPLGFFAAGILPPGSRVDGRSARLLLLWLACCILAIAIEFAQLYFPPRTVSLNDLFAECLGAAAGILLAAHGSARFRELIGSHLAEPGRFLDILLGFYLLLFIVIALFPFDFLLSADELSAKFDSNQWGWWRAELSGYRGSGWAMLQALIEVVSVIPIGLLIARRRKVASGGAAVGLMIGMGGGLVIEILQFFTYSGASQGMSVLTRAIGCMIGVSLWNHRGRLGGGSIRAAIRRLAAPAGALYLTTLIAVNGWFTRTWQGFEGAFAAFDEVRFLPFYYHYFTTEVHALSSLLSVAAQYAPLGIIGWAYGARHRVPAVIAALLASAIESSRLFLIGAHPDPTNILIAAAAAAFTGFLIGRVADALTGEASSGAGGGTGKAASAPADTARDVAAAPRVGAIDGDGARHRPVAARYAVVAVATLVVAYWLTGFPSQPVLLALVLAACSAAVWMQPLALIFLVPAALPVFDLAPWSGRFYVDEFDMLMLLGLAIGFARTRPVRAGQRDRLLAMSLALLLLSIGVALSRPLLPLPETDINAFTTYFSPFNGLRIGKGMIWGLLFWGLLRRLASRNLPVHTYWARGMACGLALTVVFIFWERAIFGGLTDLASYYRVTGLISAMHVGGAYIECFISVAAPFTLYLVLRGESLLGRLLGIGLLFAATLALMLTYSRNGYFAFAVAFLLVMGFSLSRRTGHTRKRSIILLGAAMLLAAAPVFLGKTAQERVARLGEDFAIRTAHWQDAVRMADGDAFTFLFGMGLGSYPETHYWRSSESERSAQYLLESRTEDIYLRLSTGQSLYVEQLLTIQPELKHHLSFDYRVPKSGSGSMVIAICEKWMLASSTCLGRIEVPLTDAVGDWRHVEQAVDMGILASKSWFWRGPVKLSLFNAGVVGVDIDNVSLRNVRNDELIANGDFRQGMDHWFSASDTHLAWHAKSLPVSVWFEQGWLGVLAFTLVAGLGLARAVGMAFRGSLFAAAVLAAMLAFLIIGIFDTLVDSPRFLLLFVLLSIFGSMPRQVQRRITNP